MADGIDAPVNPVQPPRGDAVALRPCAQPERAQLPAGTIYVDALWRAERVVVELDGGATHQTRKAFHNDRRRDSALAALGFVTVRYTRPRLADERRETAAELARTLAMRCSAAPWTPSLSTSA